MQEDVGRASSNGNVEASREGGRAEPWEKLDWDMMSGGP